MLYTLLYYKGRQVITPDPLLLIEFANKTILSVPKDNILKTL